MGNSPSSGGLYAFTDTTAGKAQLKVNGVAYAYKSENGYAIVEKEWKDGDKVTFEIPMDIMKVQSREELLQNKSRVALQRGPIVYCVEGEDNGGDAWNIVVPRSTVFQAESFSVLNEPVISLVANLPVTEPSADGSSLQTSVKKVRAIPYYAWCNRGSNAMQVWLPETVKNIKINY
jgi:DUF1680 family protein